MSEHERKPPTPGRSHDAGAPPDTVEEAELGATGPGAPAPSTSTGQAVMEKPIRFVELVRKALQSPHEASMCSCVSLLNAGNNLFLEADTPELAKVDDRRLQEEAEAFYEIRRVLASSPTLRYLRTGYESYRDDDPALRGFHTLSAYRCVSPHVKAYTSFRTVNCRSGEPQQSGTDKVPAWKSGSLQYNASIHIDQYFAVFSMLADFNYSRWELPDGRGITSNLLVVDKVWTFNSLKNLYVPHYRLLNDDPYTDVFVGEMKKLNHRGIPIQHVRFISTPTTSVYTNLNTLATSTGQALRKRKRERSEEDEEESEQRGGESSEQRAKRSATTLPLKKRDLQAGSSAPQGTSSDRDPQALLATFLLRVEDWRAIDHRPQCPRATAAEETRSNAEAPVPPDTDRCPLLHRPRREVKNPTLVVFKHCMNDPQPDTVICYIVEEIHLGDRILY